MGGDRGPDEVVAGALEAAADGIVPVLYGPAALDTRGLEHVVAEQVIAMDEKPAEAVRAKPDSSLVAACRAVAEGTADAVVSAGNTGAMLAAGLLEIRRLPGRDAPGDRRADPRARRPVGAARLRRERRRARRAPAPVRPHGRDLRRGDPRPRRTRRCACSRSARSRRRATSSTLEAHALLAASALNFAGNTESRDLLAKAADVVVTDGFTGNVALKPLEGTIRTVIEGLRDEITATALGKLGGLLIRPAARRLRAPARPRHLRRRLPPRPARAGRDRARKLVAARRSRTRSASRRAASSTTSPASSRRRLPAKAETPA